MALVFAAVLIIGGLVCGVAIVVGVPLVFGLMAYDVMESRTDKPVNVEDASLRIAVERGIARAFVLAGGAFWSVATFAGLYSFRNTGVSSALVAAFIPLVACAATLIVGWYFERMTAAMLLLASLAVFVWGVVYQFEPGVWLIMIFSLVGPMLTASTLFWMARRDQEAFERALVLRPELSPVFSARSTLSN